MCYANVSSDTVNRCEGVAVTPYFTIGLRLGCYGIELTGIDVACRRNEISARLLVVARRG
jgi:hypothetical protein